MTGFYVVFFVKALVTRDNQVCETVRRVAVLVEGSIGVYGTFGPSDVASLREGPDLLHVITCDEIGALADDLEVEPNSCAEGTDAP